MSGSLIVITILLKRYWFIRSQQKPNKCEIGQEDTLIPNNVIFESQMLLYCIWCTTDGVGNGVHLRFSSGDKYFDIFRERMPVILASDNWNTWLESDAKDIQALQNLLKPYPAEDMVTWPVSTKVNNPRNDSVECLEALWCGEGECCCRIKRALLRPFNCW